MPITAIRLLNFKSFEDSGPVPLRPLTLLFGRNNTGKSSILQSLLLLRQSLDSPERGPSLNLRGPLYAAGSYADIVHQHQSKRRLVIDFSCSRANGGPPSEVHLEFRSDEPQPPRLSHLRLRSPGLDTVEIRIGKGQGGPYELSIGKDVFPERTGTFHFPVSRFLPRIGDEPTRVGRPSERRRAVRRRADELLREIEGQLTSFRAVGAFRQQPIRRYDYQGRPPDSIGLAGERAIDAIIEDALRRRRRGELFGQVNRWLRDLARVKLLPVRRISKGAKIFEIRLKDIDSGRWANFADVGFGIGQALPVFVEGLRTDPGGTFLVQEPEIHLHPDAQLRMADFLVYLARSGRRVIAETHSEYLLLRVRHLVLSGEHQELAIDPGDVSIIHVDKTRVGASHARPLQIDKLGQVKDWPTGFMEDATRERIAILNEMAAAAESTG